MLRISATANLEGDMITGIKMLNADEAPTELLVKGSKFDLFEGARCVARGEVI